MADIEVLRMGHRPGRDKRVTTHVALVARAFGAQRMHLHRYDERISSGVDEVTRRFGGEFEIFPAPRPIRCIEDFSGVKVHLTMYGLPLKEKIDEIRGADRILVIAGSEKVPRDVYGKVDYNISVTSQPHSEIAALAVFLEGLVGERNYFTGGLYIVPQERGKSMSRYPTKKICIKILEDVGVPQKVIDHSFQVEERALSVAERLSKRFDLDLDLIRAGALLHDIGRSRSHAIDHFIIGAAMVREMKLPEELAGIVERHVGGGISREDAIKLGLPGKDYLPQTLEEKIVSYADNLTNDKMDRAPRDAVEKMKRLSEEIESMLAD